MSDMDTSEGDAVIKPTDWSENYDNIGEYFFESDHLALKENSDYHNLLKAVCMLEAQRVQAIRDLDTLHKQHQEALADPLAFVQRLQKKEPMSFPERQKVVELPTINWDKYSLAEGASPPMLKRKKEAEKAASELKNEEGDRVRGRLYNPSKPTTFNQLWTSQEQKMLEELLVVYPPEEVESRRWEKISKALGTRTTAQVASRVQKYFIHLRKAGLAVPGRAPRRATIVQSGKGGLSRATMTRMTSSFFKHHMPTVYMMDDQDMDELSCPASTSSAADNISIKEESRADDEEDDDISENLVYQELLFLNKLKKEKIASQPLAQHVGYKCDRCHCDPIVGIRWHCTDCPSEMSVDFCSDCVDCREEMGNHKASHHMEPVHQTSSEDLPFLDGDYLHHLGSGQQCNYLDPNYMPATTASKSKIGLISPVKSQIVMLTVKQSEL